MDYVTSMVEPLVSVIIPTFNNSFILETCLKSIKLQTYSNIEIIIVDNYSIDDTVKIAKQYNSRVLQVRALRSAARNYGIKNAEGVFLFYVDSDMELTPDVVKECVRNTIINHIDAIMIPEERVGEGFWVKCRAIERLTYIGNPLIESVRFMRKDVFLKVNGFDEELEAGEDWDLHARIEDNGYKIGKIVSKLKHHEGQTSLKQIVQKRLYYGKTIKKYIKKHPERAKIQYMRLDFFRHWRLLFNNPLYGCGMLFMKVIEYIATGLSMITSSFS